MCKTLIEANLMDTVRSLFAYKRNMVPSIYKTLEKIYYANISCSNKNYKPKLYKGSCKITSKNRYSNQTKSFNVPLYKQDTKLSTEHWNLKTKQLNPPTSWKIKGYTTPVTQLQNAVTYALQRS